MDVMYNSFERKWKNFFIRVNGASRPHLWSNTLIFRMEGISATYYVYVLKSVY
jgi:hypothetical protein